VQSSPKPTPSSHADENIVTAWALHKKIRVWVIVAVVLAWTFVVFLGPRLNLTSSSRLIIKLAIFLVAALSVRKLAQCPACGKVTSFKLNQCKHCSTQLQFGEGVYDRSEIRVQKVIGSFGVILTFLMVSLIVFLGFYIQRSTRQRDTYSDLQRSRSFLLRAYPKNSIL
jgi:hypothetical protein